MSLKQLPDITLDPPIIVLECSDSQINSAFAFGLFSEILLLLLLFCLLLHLFGLGGVTKNMLGNFATFSAPAFLVFGVIALAALGTDCTDLATANDEPILRKGKHIARINYAFSRGIVALIVGTFLVLLVVWSKFVSKKNVLFKGEAGNKPEPPAPTTTTTTTAQAGTEHTTVPMTQ